MFSIRYLKRNEIDTYKWDACIDTAGNGLIYGYTVYLDALCTAWDALILDDYKAVMPLPWRKKWGIFYLYQPFAIAQLGLFGNDLSAALLHAFLKKIPQKFQYWDMPLNFGNRFTVPPFPTYERKNYILPLDKPYEEIKAAYRQQLKRNLKKAIATSCIVQKNISVECILVLTKNQKENKGTETDFIRFKALYQALSKHGKAVTYGVTTSTGDLAASAVFFFSHHRAYYILPGNLPAGRKAGASHLLLDAFIKDHAGQALILDFEGSDIKGLQFFYSSFGAIDEPYTAIRYNRLPWYIRWMKN